MTYETATVLIRRPWSRLSNNPRMSNTTTQSQQRRQETEIASGADFPGRLPEGNVGEESINPWLQPYLDCRLRDPVGYQSGRPTPGRRWTSSESARSKPSRTRSSPANLCHPASRR